MKRSKRLCINCLEYLISWHKSPLTFIKQQPAEIYIVGAVRHLSPYASVERELADAFLLHKWFQWKTVVRPKAAINESVLIKLHIHLFIAILERRQGSRRHSTVSFVSEVCCRSAAVVKYYDALATATDRKTICNTKSPKTRCTSMQLSQCSHLSSLQTCSGMVSHSDAKYLHLRKSL